MPDSAGTITAMLTGVKTRAGVLGVDETVARGDFAAAREGQRADAARAGRGSRPVDRRRHHHDDHARDAGRHATRIHRSATGRSTRSSRPRRARRASPTSRASSSSSRTATASRSRSAAAARSSCPRRATDPEDREADGRARSTAAIWSPSGRSATRAAPTSGTRTSSRALDPAKTAAPARPVRARPHEVRGRSRDRRRRRAVALADDRRRRSTVLERAPKGYFLMVEGGPHRPRPPRRQRLPRARRDDRVLERRAPRARAHEARRDADRRHRRPQPHAHDLRLPEARESDPRPGGRLVGRGRAEQRARQGPHRSPLHHTRLRERPRLPGRERRAARGPEALAALRQELDREGHEGPTGSLERRHAGADLPAGVDAAARLRDARRRGRADLRRRPERGALPRRARAELHLPRDGRGARDPTP